MLANAARIGSKGLIAAGLIYLLLPEGHVQGFRDYVRGQYYRITPIEVRITAISEQIATRRTEVEGLRQDVARMDEARVHLRGEADELGAQVERRRVRLAAGEQAARQGGRLGAQAFAPDELARAIEVEREALAQDVEALRERQFRAQVLADRGALFTRRIGEIEDQVGELERRLVQVRRVQDENEALEQLVAIQAEIARQFAVPGTGVGTPQVGDELVELENEGNAYRAYLVQQLTEGVGPQESLLDRVLQASTSEVH